MIIEKLTEIIPTCLVVLLQAVKILLQSLILLLAMEIQNVVQGPDANS